MMPSPSPLESAGTPRIGEVVSGKYRLEQSLASGGMGILVLASQLGLGRKVVVKFLRDEAASNEEIVARFLREARTASTLLGDHVVRVLDVGSLPSGAPYFVMEHLDGRDLSDELGANGPLAPETAAAWVLEACEALAEAHGRGVVHRDLKPSNLFLAKAPDGSRRLKVLDFGISKAAPEPGDRPLTATRAVLGTPDYMSPEQIRDFRNVDARSDVWSLGVVLYELLSGERPFEAPNAAGLCVAIATEPPVPLRTRRSEIPKTLESVVLRCLRKDPAERFSSIGGLAHALATFAPEASRKSIERIDAILGSRPASDTSSDARRSALTEAVTDPFDFPGGPSALAGEARRKRSTRLVRVSIALGALGLATVVAVVASRKPVGAPKPTSSKGPSEALRTSEPASLAPASAAPETAVSTLVVTVPSAPEPGREAAPRPAASGRTGTPKPARAPNRKEDVLGKKAFSDRK